MFPIPSSIKNGLKEWVSLIQNRKGGTHMKYLLSVFACVLMLSLSLSSCTDRTSVSVSAEENPPEELFSVTLKETEDRGQAYLDSFIFLGESTTYHLKSRGVLSGGTETTQVWAPAGGTLNLDQTTSSVPLLYPDTGEYLTLSQAVTRKRPAFLLLTFGLNGAVQNIKRGEDYYKSCYRKLLDTVIAASPETKIILQSGFPVAANMDMSVYSCTLDQLNEHIETINGWVWELAEEYGLRYLSTNEILKDENGRLKMSYQNGDGHHLTRQAYLEILHYIRIHGYE